MNFILILQFLEHSKSNDFFKHKRLNFKSSVEILIILKPKTVSLFRPNFQPFNVNQKLRYSLSVVFLLFPVLFFAQDVSLFEQFNGRYDFIFIGNTLNTSENNLNTECTITNTSSAALSLHPADEIQNAYLYWAGSGTGDFEVTLNGNSISAQRRFALFQNGFDYFCAFTDITSQIQSTGNGNYTLSDLDLQPFITPETYCSNRTNFGGWAIVIVYKNENLPLNQLNIYDGLQGVSRDRQNLSLTLNSLNVIDNEGAKIGFVAWEGDKNLAVNETLKINENTLSNALNPPNNAFNGTNTFTNSDTLYNMDLDVYDIQNHIQVGNQTAEIQLTSGQDFVMISTIVTKLNSQLPDATISIDKVDLQCNSRILDVNYTVYNINSTQYLPARVPISIYADSFLIQTIFTDRQLAIGDSYSSSISLTIPPNLPNDFTLKFVIDDTGNGIGIIKETNENNNIFSIAVSLITSPKFNTLERLFSCNKGLTAGNFDFSDYEDIVKTNPNHEVQFFNSYEEALDVQTPILDSHDYVAQSTPKVIFVRIDDGICFAITSFFLDTKKCKPLVHNAFSPNNDNINDYFQIDGLRDIFLNFKLSIFNRWGTLIWKGGQNTENWYGQATEGMLINGNQVPDGTYFYVLELNDAAYPEALTGWVYLTR